eukprot:1157653-Pelagomonas_calceolata.AAC.3
MVAGRGDKGGVGLDGCRLLQHGGLNEGQGALRGSNARICVQGEQAVEEGVQHLRKGGSRQGKCVCAYTCVLQAKTFCNDAQLTA